MLYNIFRENLYLVLLQSTASFGTEIGYKGMYLAASTMALI
ncbi:hypothetical protein [Virgibacillus sp. JSM 102003]